MVSSGIIKKSVSPHAHTCALNLYYTTNKDYLDWILLSNNFRLNVIVKCPVDSSVNIRDIKNRTCVENTLPNE